MRSEPGICQVLDKIFVCTWLKFSSLHRMTLLRDQESLTSFLMFTMLPHPTPRKVYYLIKDDILALQMHLQDKFFGCPFQKRCFKFSLYGNSSITTAYLLIHWFFQRTFPNNPTHLSYKGKASASTSSFATRGRKIHKEIWIVVIFIKCCCDI